MLFSPQSFEKYSKLNFMKICPVGGELLLAGGRTEGRTDTDKQTNTQTDKQIDKRCDEANGFFCNFSKAPKTGPCCVLNMHIYGFLSNINIGHCALNVFSVILHIPLSLILISDIQVSVCMHSVSVT